MFEQSIFSGGHTCKTRRVAMGTVSLSLHLAAIAALWLVWLMTRGGINSYVAAPHISVDLPRLLLRHNQSSGGGNLSKLPVSRGDAAPPRAMKTFVMPLTNPQAQLQIPVSMPSLDAPNLDTAQYGDPNGDIGPPSLGPGGPNGVGVRGTGGVGGGTGDQVFTPGHGVTSPILISKVEPDYTDEARRVKRSGTVSMRIVVDARGVPISITVTQPLGFGLDQRAVEAVKHWRFRPGTRDGRAVAVEATVEVSFRLL